MVKIGGRALTGVLLLVLIAGHAAAGQSNHSDNLQTIVEVGIIDENVTFRVIQAPDGKKNFSLREEWEIRGRQGGRWQNDPKPLSAFEKAAGSSAVRPVVP